MKSYKITTRYHHHDPRPEYTRVHEVPDGIDPYLHALTKVLENEFCIEPPVLAANNGLLAETMAKLKEKGDADLRMSEMEDSEPVLHRLWLYVPDEGRKTPNFGISGSERVWIDVEPYEPDAGLFVRLQSLDKSQLIELLLRVHAEQSRLPWPKSE